MGRRGGAGAARGRAGSVFRVAGGRAAKARARRGARPVTTALRKIHIVNEEKVRALNKALDEAREEAQQRAGGTAAAEPQEPPQVSNDVEHEPANVDAATNLLSQL